MAQVIDRDDGSMVVLPPQPAPTPPPPPAPEPGGGSVRLPPGAVADDDEAAAPWEGDADPDFEGGELSDDDVAAWELEADAWFAGDLRGFAAANAFRPGDLLNTEGKGAHTGKWQHANALDVFLYPGTAVTAVAAGRVGVSPPWGYGLEAAAGRWAGWRLHVIHAGGLVSFVHHLRRIVATPGEKVQAGTILGYSGIAAGAPRLHFAVAPPFSPRAYVGKAYNTKIRDPFKPPPGSGGIDPIPSPRTGLAPKGVDRGWNNLMDALGHDLPADVRDAAALRRDIGKLL